MIIATEHLQNCCFFWVVPAQYKEGRVVHQGGPDQEISDCNSNLHKTKKLFTKW